MKPQCPKCSGTFFAADSAPVKNLNIEVVFIRCESCYTIIGVIDTTTADKIRKMKV